MGKSSNKRKSVRQPVALGNLSINGGVQQPPALVNDYSKGGITLRAERAFPPELAPLVAHAFRHFVNEDVKKGSQLVAMLTSLGYDLFDFTMATTNNAQLGHADPLVWAWGSDSAAALHWLTDACLKRPATSPYPNFFAILPRQLELAEEIFEKFARDLRPAVLLPTIGQQFENQPRAHAIVKKIVEERFALEEHAELTEHTLGGLSSFPSQRTGTRRL
jgi:hypothetical protein